MVKKYNPAPKKQEVHFCRECTHVTEVTKFHTLSLKGEPTLGECPHWKESRCVLLSQKSCNKFEPRNESAASNTVC